MVFLAGRSKPVDPSPSNGVVTYKAFTLQALRSALSESRLAGNSSSHSTKEDIQPFSDLSFDTMDSFAVDDDDEDEVNPGDELEEATAVTAETTADDSCQCQCDAGVRGGVGGGGATKDELSDEGCYFVSLASSPVQATQVCSLTQFFPFAFYAAQRLVMG